MQKLLYIFIILSLSAGSTYAQKYPERSEVRKGNKKFGRSEYPKSIEHYQNALRLAPDCFEAGFNLGNAFYKSEAYDKSEETLKVVAADSIRNENERAEAFYNLGNAQFQQKKYQEALESYKNSLRMNPDDREAKYNYAYTKWLLKKNDQDKNNDKNKDKQDQNQDQNKDQNKDQNGQNGDQDKDRNDKGDQNKDGQQDEKKDGDVQPQKSQSGISPQEQERMLDAIQAQEDKTQDKLKEKTSVVVRGGKNW